MLLKCAWRVFFFLIGFVFLALIDGAELCFSLGNKTWRERESPHTHTPLLTTANGLAPLSLGQLKFPYGKGGWWECQPRQALSLAFPVPPPTLSEPTA